MFDAVYYVCAAFSFHNFPTVAHFMCSVVSSWLYLASSQSPKKPLSLLVSKKGFSIGAFALYRFVSRLML
jgi:hypothetical protein